MYIFSQILPRKINGKSILYFCSREIQEYCHFALAYNDYQLVLFSIYLARTVKSVKTHP